MDNALSRLQVLPGLRQMLLLAGLAAAIAAGLWLFFWSQQPGFVPLYAELGDREAAEVADALRASGIEFKIDEASGAVTVREPVLREARMKLAAQGLPQQSASGFELMSGEQGFGASQLVENARYQHALETELARTVATLRPVRGARVHLALPKPTAFSRQHNDAGASVVLDLFSGRTLDDNQIAAIVNLVASSIPNLPPERVTVVDQSGRLLTRVDGAEESQANRQFDQVRRVEASYVERVQQLLEPMLGPGRVSAQVAIDMDFSETEEAREQFGPDSAQVRSEQTSEQVDGSAAAAMPTGIPGAASNTPPGPVATAAATATASAAAAVPGSRSATRNFELDRTLTHSRQPGGRIRRLTTAVLVDNVQAAGKDGKAQSRPLTAAQIAQVESLVKQAVGFDTARGDSVSVMNAPFVREAAPDAEDALPIWQQPSMQNYLRLGIGALAVLALLFGVLRPTLRQLVTPRPALPAPVLHASVEGPAMLAPMPVAAGGRAMPAPEAAPASPYEERLRVARAAVSDDPKRVAQVVKAWVGNDG